MPSGSPSLSFSVFPSVYFAYSTVASDSAPSSFGFPTTTQRLSGDNQNNNSPAANPHGAVQSGRETGHSDNDQEFDAGRARTPRSLEEGRSDDDGCVHLRESMENLVYCEICFPRRSLIPEKREFVGFPQKKKTDHTWSSQKKKLDASVPGLRGLHRTKPVNLLTLIMVHHG